MKKVWQLLLILAVVATMIGLGLAFFQSGRPSSPGARVTRVPCKPQAPLPAQTGHYLGIIMRHPGPPPFRANLGEFYTPFGGYFPEGAASEYRRHGLTPFIQIDPRKVSIASIASGGYDQYLHRFATAAKNFCTALIMSFGHEFNGQWYSWGVKHVAPSIFVAAWKRIYTIFQEVKARNVTWAWDPDALAKAPRPWWPGSQYVNWIGIDGYFRKRNDISFKDVFVERIQQIRQFTSKPMLIAETGAPPGSNRIRQVRALISGVKRYELLGLVWFDLPGLQNYNINHDRAALHVFEKAQLAG